MKILIIRNAFSYDYGGGERFPVHLAVELQKNGHTSFILSRSSKLLAFANECNVPHLKGWWWSRQSWTGRGVILFPLYFLWQCALTLWYLRLISSLRPDVVHPQSKDDFIAATIAGRILRKHVIWTDHADLKYVFANHMIWYKNPVGKLVYLCSKLASAITLVSHSEESLIAVQLGHDVPGNFIVIHNGTNDTAVEPYTISKSQQGKFIFCTTSRLVTAKGIGELIEAFIAIHEKHTDTLLWLVGDGPESARFKAQANAHPGIQFIGHSDMPLTYVAACDVFVHPSHHEGFSLSLVEAAMLAKPIIACDVGGNVEIIHDQSTGLMVPIKNVDALRKAMDVLYTDRELAKILATNARRLYEKEFRFDKIVKQHFIPLYEK